MKKRKLVIDEQIQNLKQRGVKFSLMNEDEAKRFLRYNNYFFKLKSYARNYDTYKKKDLEGKYINLEFAYLVELSTLDMHLRKLIVEMCLDIEHVLKTRLLYDMSINSREDGYNIVSKYLDGNYNVLKDMFSNEGKSATGELIKKFHGEDIPIWSFIEALSFGKFIELYGMYYHTYGERNYYSYLGSIKFLRNASAHNTCLLNSIRIPYSARINKTKGIMEKLSKIKNIPTSYKKKMENPVIHDFVVLLFLYNDLLNCPANRAMRDRGMENIYNFFEHTVKRNEQYFKKNDVLRENYKFICIILKYLSDHKNKKLL